MPLSNSNCALNILKFNSSYTINHNGSILQIHETFPVQIFLTIPTYCVYL